MTKKIIFYSGVFWPKNPYFEINFINYLKNQNPTWSIKLLLDENDTRIDNISNNKTLINFQDKYNNKDIIILKKYEELVELTKDIDLLIGTNIIVDRRKITFDNLCYFIKCKILIIDLFGYDIVKKNTFNNADYIFVKGPIFKKWLIKNNFNKKNIYITGSPYFDYYKKNNFNNFDKDKKDFCKKYNLNKDKQILCLTTTNLCSGRMSMNKQNLQEIIIFYEKFEKKYNFILISYPNDYLFYEINKKSRRSKIQEDIPDYLYIQQKLKKLKIIECQDNNNSLKYSDKIFHLSVGALSSEILFFFNKISYTMNFDDKEYYTTKIGYSKNIRFPDDICNINLKDIYDLDKVDNGDKDDIKDRKNKIDGFFIDGFSHENINNTLNLILK